jgi:histidinol-phosphate aminotransferase
VTAVIRPEVLALSAYHVPDADGFLKLDAMENPYSFLPNCSKRFRSTLPQCR